MNVRAKFKVTSVQHNEGGVVGVSLTAIHGADNRTWSKWTPSGSLTMTITNPDASSQFVPGKCVFLDVSEAPDKESDEHK